MQLSKLIKLTAFAGASVLVLAGCAANEAEQPATSNPTSTQSSTDGSPAELSGTLDGSGASSMAAGQEAWVAAFQTANPGVTVNYNPTGSGTGRDQFEQGLTFFTGSDAYFKDEELATNHPNCAGDTAAVFEFPIWISPIAVIFNLDGIENLNMTPATIAKIFSGQVTNWSDAEIQSANPGVSLPDLAITYVHRSDESGTSENFTDWLAKAAPSAWVDTAGAPLGAIETWPSDVAGEGAQGTSGVVAAVAAGNGTIGYADASRAGDLGTVAVGVGENFVPFSPEAAAKIVDVSEVVEGRPDTSLAYELRRDTTESGVYPVVLVSYLQGCMDYVDDSKGELVKAYANFLISEEGQGVAAAAAGSAPISSALREKAQTILDSVE
ncbi:MAG: phosphate ABC transporter substrate-binding protein PstS [Aquiluna sp.]|jgi:phosphate transport system substrate-binding protein